MKYHFFLFLLLIHSFFLFKENSTLGNFGFKNSTHHEQNLNDTSIMERIKKLQEEMNANSSSTSTNSTGFDNSTTVFDNTTSFDNSTSSSSPVYPEVQPAPYPGEYPTQERQRHYYEQDEDINFLIVLLGIFKIAVFIAFIFITVKWYKNRNERLQYLRNAQNANITNQLRNQNPRIIQQNPELLRWTQPQSVLPIQQQVFVAPINPQNLAHHYYIPQQNQVFQQLQYGQQQPVQPQQHQDAL